MILTVRKFESTSRKFRRFESLKDRKFRITNNFIFSLGFKSEKSEEDGMVDLGIRKVFELVL